MSDGRENIRSNEWWKRMMGYLADWRAEAAVSYKHKLGTIIVFGNCMESIDAPAIRVERDYDNDNSLSLPPK